MTRTAARTRLAGPTGPAVPAPGSARATATAAVASVPPGGAPVRSAVSSAPPADVSVPLGPGAAALAAAFVVSGATHLVRPRVFEGIVPRWLPARRGLVLASGVLELACAAGLVVARTRRPAALASAALLVAVYPANVQMAVDAVRRGRPAYRAVALARLPLQAPLVVTALRAARRR